MDGKSVEYMESYLDSINVTQDSYVGEYQYRYVFCELAKVLLSYEFIVSKVVHVDLFISLITEKLSFDELSLQMHS